jgi:death on curing protein
MDEPTWVSRVVADSAHYMQLQEHGGSHGIRDDAAIEAALGRPRNKFANDVAADMAGLAAAYAFALATLHGYIDGNKRTAAVVALIFLELNGYDLNRSNDDLEATMLALANHEIDEQGLAQWIREALAPLPPNGSEAGSPAEG